MIAPNLTISRQFILAGIEIFVNLKKKKILLLKMTSLDQPDFSSIFQNYLEKLKENFTEKELNELKAGKLVAKVEIKTKTMMEKLENVIKIN